ncbi:MAG: hypothetical protein JWR85_1947 [Marmoricola sp.]|nr:hypothetical protein [Marmoricola sp.]
MIRTGEPARPLRHLVLAAGTALALALSLLAGMAGAASAAGERTWTLTDVTFDDGGQMTGSFVFSDGGEVSDVHVTTTGGDTGTYGPSTTYDASTAQLITGILGPGTYIMLTNDSGRYINLALGDLSGVATGVAVPLNAESWECMNCSPARFVATGSVVAGDPAVAVLAGTPAITGEPQVDQTLTGDDSQVTSDPADATRSYQWLRDDAPIEGANDTTFLLTNDDAGHTITFSVGATKAGYGDATPVTSDAVGPVDGGQITLPTPTIDGTPVVDGTLSATLPDGLDPSDATVVWQWFRGSTAVGNSTSTYTPNAADAGHALTVTATATKDSFDDVSESQNTAPIANATFTSPPSATITGTVKVGRTLTANPGTVSPTPDQLAYQWYSDGDAINSATHPSYVLTAAQRHTAMTVRVTATRAGYDDASDTSLPTADVATDLAPSLSFTAEDSTIRRGQHTTLDWDTTDAVTVTASGGWSGPKAVDGTANVGPTALGDTIYVLSAVNANGTTTSQVPVNVTRPAKQLAVNVRGGLHLAGGGIWVVTRGLDGAEPYAISIEGIRVASGNATASGRISRHVTIPASIGERTASITVTGSERDRSGFTTNQIVANKTLGLRLGKSVVRPRHRQWVTVTGMVPGEPVTVAFRGVRVSPSTALAGASGSYGTVFRVGRLRGVKQVRVTGAFSGRTATKTFTLKRR